MLKKIGDLIKNFEKEHKVCLDANDAIYYWIVKVWSPHGITIDERMYNPKCYVTGYTEQGYVLILHNFGSTNRYTVEYWGVMDNFEIFVRKAMVRTLEELVERKYCAETPYGQDVMGSVQ